MPFFQKATTPPVWIVDPVPPPYKINDLLKLMSGEKFFGFKRNGCLWSDGKKFASLLVN